MLSMKTVLTVEVNEKEYEFTCNPNSPLVDALEACSQFKAFLLGKKQMADEAQSASSESAQPEQPQDAAKSAETQAA